jgi:hypothetical protein
MKLKTINFNYLFFLVCFLCQHNLYSHLPKQKIALCIVATGEYIRFADQLIKSARIYFLPNHDVTYFVFSDSSIEGNDIISVYQKKENWPLGTLMRFSMYAKQKEALSHYNYIFAIDADMLCYNYIGDEILEERVGTAHPGFAMHRSSFPPSFDPNRESCVYIPENERAGTYFAGAFYGGSQKEFVKLVETCSQTVRLDLSHGIIAEYHDENHLNWYFRKNKPTKILSPSYCYPDSNIKAKTWRLTSFKKRILCLEKGLEYFKNK